jgi:hypothetical protein
MHRSLNFAEADAQGNYDCSNDGQQFRLSQIQLVGNKADPDGGQMSSPYDTKIHNLYRISGETEHIKQYWVKLTMTGTNDENVAAEVYHVYGRRNITLATRASQKLKVKGDFSLKGPDMRLALNVVRDEQCYWKFEYGDISDGIAWFPFTSGKEGYGNFALKRSAKQVKGHAPYCIDISKTDSAFLCSFPAW